MLNLNTTRLNRSGNALLLLVTRGHEGPPSLPCHFTPLGGSRFPLYRYRKFDGPQGCSGCWRSIEILPCHEFITNSHALITVTQLLVTEVFRTLALAFFFQLPPAVKSVTCCLGLNLESHCGLSDPLLFGAIALNEIR